MPVNPNDDDSGSRSGYFYKGRHRLEPTHVVSRSTIASTIAIGTVVGIGTAPPAYAAPDEVWDRLAQCESSGNWSINTGNGYSGGLQFSPTTWDEYRDGQFSEDAFNASREQQIVVAERVLAGQGWGAWPACSRRLGIRDVGVDLRDTPTERASQVETPSTTSSPPAVSPEPNATTQERPSGDTYVVVSGDTLSEIARDETDGITWEQLFNNNREVVENAHLIYPGEVLNISL